jgi:hypothetical protein
VKTQVLKARRRVRKAWQFLTSYIPSRRNGDLFSHVRTFCMFVGYPRSGHTLVGSLIDAHPRAIISNELNVIGHVKRGFSKDQIYTLIVANSQAFAKSGSEWNGYHYAVRHQWQGRCETLEVIGDKRGAGTIRQLRANPGLFERMQRTIDADLRFIHVIRNPFDNISTIVRRHRWPLEQAISYYFGLCRTVADLKTLAGTEAMLDVFHEQLIARPSDEISAICRFLGLEPYPDYVRDCAGIIFPAPRHTRTEVAWSPELVASVGLQARAVPWLQHYGYDA